MRGEPGFGDAVDGVGFRAATVAGRADLLALMRAELAERLERTLALLGMTWPQFEALELGVEASNARARAWYLRHGFEVTERLPELGFEVMRKPLMDRDGGGSSGEPR